MSEENLTGIKVLENVLIKSGPDVNITSLLEDDSSKDATKEDDIHINVEREISAIVQHSDPISPATAVPSKDTGSASEDDDPKVILNLEVASLPKTELEEEMQLDNQNSNAVQKSLQQLGELNTGIKLRSNTVSKDPLSISSAVNINEVLLEKASKTPIKLHNRVNDRCEQDTSGDLLSTSLEKYKSSNDNEDLVAILEGKDEDDKEDKSEHYQVFEVVNVLDESKMESTVVTSLLTKEEERKIAMDQMSQFYKGGKFKKRKADDSGPSDLVNALVSDWSDTEKDGEAKASEAAATKKGAQKNVKNEKKPVKSAGKASPKTEVKPEIKSEPKPEVTIEPFRRTRVIKKKIIWDPDAPETQFSYASLVQSSAKKPLPQKKARLTPTPRKVESPVAKVKDEPTTTLKGKRRPETPTILNNKKKKIENEKTPEEKSPKSVESEKDTRLKKEAIATVAEKQTKTLAKKRVPKGKSAASSWDYVYNKRSDDSMIIRRRSNSSYSSTSPRRMSLEQIPQNKINPKGKAAAGNAKLIPVLTKVPISKVPASTRNSVVVKAKAFEFAKPEAKKATKKENDIPEVNITAEIKKAESRESLRKSSRTPVNVEETPVKAAPAPVKTLTGKAPTEAVTIKKFGNIVQFVLHPKTDKFKNSFTIQLMNEISKNLEVFKSENTCKVVFFTSAAPNFCLGLDYISLTAGPVEKRKNAAAELAACVKNFLQTLATFPKPLLAGITGTCAGIGVTMLPLFDIVISSDKSVYETSYAKIGQIPEGHCILNLTNNVRHNFKTKLLWLCERINATEAALSGLVSKLTSSSKIQDDSLLCARKVAGFSQSTFLSIKAQRQKIELPKIIAALAEEQKILTQQWVSPECQEKFKQYLEKDSW